MNLFQTTVSNDGGTHWKVVASDSLGDDTGYVQSKVGEVTQISYSEDDGDLVNNVKVGAINALHTHLVAAGDTKTVTESTPVGVHTSTMVGSVGLENKLHVAKTFDQAAIHLYADPNLKPGQLAFENQQYVLQHPEGWLHSASCHQDSLLMKSSVDVNGMVHVGSAPSDGDVTMQYTSTLHSRGTFNLTYIPPSEASAAAVLHAQRMVALDRRASSPQVATTFLDYARSQIVEARKLELAATGGADTAAPEAAAVKHLRDLPSNHDFPFNRSYSSHARIGPAGSHHWDTLYANEISLRFTHFPPIFARELCQIALSPIGRRRRCDLTPSPRGLAS
jgi:hypothetical protein